MLILKAQYNDNNTTLISIITAKLFTFNYHNKRITTMRMQEKTTRRVEQMPAPSSEQAAQSRWWGRCRGCARWHEGGDCNGCIEGGGCVADPFPSLKSLWSSLTYFLFVNLLVCGCHCCVTCRGKNYRTWSQTLHCKSQSYIVSAGYPDMPYRK